MTCVIAVACSPEAFEMIKLGFDEWDLIDRYARNQLVESQIKNSDFLEEYNETPDTIEETCRDMKHRIIGGFTGHAEPNSIPLSNRRAIAGCCSGVAPQAHCQVWKNIVTEHEDTICVNLLMEYEGRLADISCKYPNEGYTAISLKRSGPLKLRIPTWIGERFTLKVNGKQVPCMWQDNYLVLPDSKSGDVIEIIHSLCDSEKLERVSATEYTITWRGSTVVKILPEGRPYRLFDRNLDKKVEGASTAGMKKSLLIHLISRLLIKSCKKFHMRKLNLIR